MAENKIKEAYERRLMNGNDALNEAYAALNKESDTFFQDLESIAKLHKEVNADYKNYCDLQDEDIKARLEQARIRNEERKSKNDRLLNWLRIGVSIGTGGLGLFMFLKGESNKDRRIDMITRKEEDDAFLTLRDRTLATEALREDNSGTRRLFSFPFFK